MRTVVLERTYNPDDCTSVGWRIEWNAGRLMAQLRNRWKGSRDGVRILIGRMDLPSARQWVSDTMPSMLVDTFGDLHLIYPITSKGWVVR